MANPQIRLANLTVGRSSAAVDVTVVVSMFESNGSEPRICAWSRVIHELCIRNTYLLCLRDSSRNDKTDTNCVEGGTCPEIEPLTVSELNEYVITADAQIIEFLCTAKVNILKFMLIKVGAILASPNVQRNSCKRYLHSHFSFVIRLMLWVYRGTVWNSLCLTRLVQLF
ncbi:Uncharacterized protein Rs2_29673 [Raphanus sativus]|nr:Uncharacterized protein Rs2_29673 [Raphanus sativus]